MITSILKILHHLSGGKKSTWSFMFSLRYCKDIVNWLFLNFGNAWPSSAANNGRSLAIVDHLRTLVSKKNLDITKMTDHFSHTQKRILKLSNLKDLFFFRFYYSTPLKLFSELRYTRKSYLPYSCMNVELEWIPHSWKQFLFFLQETLCDYSLWNVRINLTDGQWHT